MQTRLYIFLFLSLFAISFSFAQSNSNDPNYLKNVAKLHKYSKEELLKELQNRDLASFKKGIELNKELKHISSELIFEVVVVKERLQTKSIYGEDNRQDLFAVTDPQVLSDADCVVSLMKVRSIEDIGGGMSALKTSPFTTYSQVRLCDGVRFAGQPRVAFCSGFLVAADIIATAGHCVDDETDLETTRFVFGFKMIDPSSAHTIISNNEIYSGIRIIGRQLQGDGADWALIQLDRPVTNHRIAQIRRDNRIAADQALHVIGHPLGLTLKFADRAKVTDNSSLTHFTTNLDTFGGNSGSPVFNSQTHVVEGILVRGRDDFKPSPDGSCVMESLFPDPSGGEDCTRTTLFSSFVPMLGENDNN